MSNLELVLEVSYEFGATGESPFESATIWRDVDTGWSDLEHPLVHVLSCLIENVDQNLYILVDVSVVFGHARTKDERVVHKEMSYQNKVLYLLCIELAYDRLTFKLVVIHLSLLHS